MPSVNWREVADNWFGACCCSFGGVSEKLVTRYTNSYSCPEGMCLLNATSIILCKDDLQGWKFPHSDGSPNNEFEIDFVDDDDSTKTTLESGSNHGRKENVDCSHVSETIELPANQKSFLNGFLGNVFMVGSSHLSKDVEWVDFKCNQCSSLLGAYPCGGGHAPLDDGVRLFKCYISTCLPVGGSGDMFRAYTLERMFTNQLVESAKDELSFRTVVRDLRTKSPLLQIVLLNPNSWCCSDYCWGTEGTMEPVSKIDLCPVIKVLFSDCSNSTESQLRMIEEWVTKNLADEVYMLTHQIKELIESLESAKDRFPRSYAFLQGLPLSSMQR